MPTASTSTFDRAFDVCDGVEIRHVEGERGYGLFSTRPLPEGTVLFREYPLVCMQEQGRARTVVCERCCRFLGPLEMQLRALLRTEQLPTPDGTIPRVDNLRPLPLPEPCLGGCSLLFCSESCARAEYTQGHSLLCPGPTGGVVPASFGRTPSESSHRQRGQMESLLGSFALASASATAGGGVSAIGGASGSADALGCANTVASVGMTDRVAEAFSVRYERDRDVSSRGGGSGVSGAEGGSTSGGGGDGDGGGGGGKRRAPSVAGSESDPEEDGDVPVLEHASSPLDRFERHARATNPIFLLAAKAVALILVQCAAGDSLEKATEGFPGPAWWDAVPSPSDTDPSSFRETLRRLVTQSWLLLCAVLAKTHAGPSAPGAAPFFRSPQLYATIVGSFERRNCALAVSSPVEEYFLLLDSLPEGQPREGPAAATRPLLDSLGSRYRAHCEGTGLFTAQAILNHDCQPNVTLLKPTGEDEHDCRVVASLLRNVKAGEELVNSYVDGGLPLNRRRRELLEYGFVCRCAKCQAEEAAAAAMSAAAFGQAVACSATALGQASSAPVGLAAASAAVLLPLPGTGATASEGAAPKGAAAAGAAASHAAALEKDAPQDQRHRRRLK